MDAILLSPEDAALRLGCRRSFLFALIRTGELRSLKLGRLRRIPTAALDEYVQRRLAAAAADDTTEATPLALR